MRYKVRVSGLDVRPANAPNTIAGVEVYEARRDHSDDFQQRAVCRFLHVDLQRLSIQRRLAEVRAEAVAEELDFPERWKLERILNIA